MIDIFTDASLINSNNIFSIAYAIHFPNKEHNDIVNSIYVNQYSGDADIHYAELYGIYSAVLITCNHPYEQVNIWTDSMHSVNAIHKWMDVYNRNGTEKMMTNNNNPIKNRNILIKIFDLINISKNKFVFSHVKAHVKSAEYKYVHNKIVDKMVRKHVRGIIKNK